MKDQQCRDVNVRSKASAVLMFVYVHARRVEIVERNGSWDSPSVVVRKEEGEEKEREEQRLNMQSLPGPSLPINDPF